MHTLKPLLLLVLFVFVAHLPTASAVESPTAKVQSPSDAVEAYGQYRKGANGTDALNNARLRAHCESSFNRGFRVDAPGFSPEGQTWVVMEKNAAAKTEVVAWIDAQTGRVVIVSEAVNRSVAGKPYPAWITRLTPPDWWNEKRGLWLWGGPWIILLMATAVFAAVSRSASAALLNCLACVGFLLLDSWQGGWIAANIGTQRVWWFVVAIPLALLSSYVIARRTPRILGLASRLSLPRLFMISALIWSYFLFIDAIDPMRAGLNSLTPAWFDFITTYPAWWLQWGEAGPTSMRPYMAPLQAIMVVTFWLMVVRAWRSIPRGKARMTPQWAIGGMFIPLFNIYWLFNVIVGLVTDLHRAISRRETPGMPPMRSLAIVLVVLWLAIDLPLAYYLELHESAGVMEMVAAAVFLVTSSVKCVYLVYVSRLTQLCRCPKQGHVPNDSPSCHGQTAGVPRTEAWPFGAKSVPEAARQIAP